MSRIRSGRRTTGRARARWKAASTRSSCTRARTPSFSRSPSRQATTLMRRLARALVALESAAALSEPKALFTVRRQGTGFIGNTNVNLALQEISPPLARDLANFEASGKRRPAPPDRRCDGGSEPRRRGSGAAELGHRPRGARNCAARYDHPSGARRCPKQVLQRRRPSGRGRPSTPTLINDLKQSVRPTLLGGAREPALRRSPPRPTPRRTSRPLARGPQVGTRTTARITSWGTGWTRALSFRISPPPRGPSIPRAHDPYDALRVAGHRAASIGRRERHGDGQPWGTSSRTCARGRANEAALQAGTPPSVRRGLPSRGRGVSPAARKE